MEAAVNHDDLRRIAGAALVGWGSPYSEFVKVARPETVIGSLHEIDMVSDSERVQRKLYDDACEEILRLRSALRMRTARRMV